MITELVNAYNFQHDLKLHLIILYYVTVDRKIR